MLLSSKNSNHPLCAVRLTRLTNLIRLYKLDIIFNFFWTVASFECISKMSYQYMYPVLIIVVTQNTVNVCNLTCAYQDANTHEFNLSLDSREVLELEAIMVETDEGGMINHPDDL